MTPIEDRYAVGCGRCGRPVPTGGAHLVVDYHAAGSHQLFCADGCCPCVTDPTTVGAYRGDLSR